MQPFASLIALRAKRIETRSRDFTGGHKGPLLIHASKRFPRENRKLCSREPFISVFTTWVRNLPGDPGYDTTGLVVERPDQLLPLGRIIAVCDLVDVVPMGEGEEFRPYLLIENHLRNLATRERIVQEWAFGDYSPGRYMLLLSNIYALPEPIPARGSLGLWEFEMEDPRAKGWPGNVAP
jgi:hypothetical protein